MQTFDARLLASHSVSTRAANTDLPPEKPPYPGEQFGDLMERALTEKSRRPNAANPVKDPARPKKSPPSPATDQTGPDDNEADAPEITAHKRSRAAAAANPDETSTALAAHFLPIAGPAASSLGSTPQPVSASAKGAGGTSSAVLNSPIHAETPGTGPTTETLDPRAEPFQSKADPRGAEAKGSPEHSAAGSPRSGTITEDSASQSAEPQSDKADPAGALAVPGTDPQNAQTTAPKASAEITASPPGLDGTSAAKQDMTMKKAEKTQKVAGPAEQDLPGTAATGSEELPTGKNLSAKGSSPGSDKLDSITAIEAPAAIKISTPAESPAPAITTAAVAPAAGIDIRVLERTHDIVALHAMRLSDSGSGSLHVVVKPGAGIQLSLELRQRDGGIEVRASLHKGDFEHLSQHWPELQQRLETRGVRVGMLTASENFSSASHQQFQQSKQQSSRQDPLYAGAFAEFALAGSMTEPPAARAARATAYRGWETWA